MKSILHIGKFYPPYNGGMETHVRDLAVRQSAHAKVTVIVANSVRSSESSVVDGVLVIRVPRIATIASMPICPGLAMAIRRCPSDLVHLHMPHPAAALALLLSGHTGKVVITHHADTLGRRYLRYLSDPFVRAVMRRASRIIVTSKRYLESSTELRPFVHKCCVVPLGIDVKDFRCRDRSTIQSVRNQFGDRLVLAVGRLVPYKGFDVLIRAMRDVDAKLILIGSGPQFQTIERLIKSEGAQEKITMLGRVEDIRPFFEAASVFVLPSLTRAEAFGLVQIEAMAAGVPVINTNIDSGVPEVSIDGLTGLTVPPHNWTSLAKAMRLLLDRRDLREQFGQSAKIRANSEYTSDIMAERIEAIYEDVLVSKAP